MEYSGGTPVDVSRTFETGWKRRSGATWPKPDSVEASAGSGGIVDGYTMRWDSLMSTTLRISRQR